MTRTTCRSSRAASDKNSLSAAWRSGQSCAAAQPSSTMKTIGPVEASRACGLSSGRARAKITRAASVMRSRISHSGVRAGVSSRGISPSSSRIAGKTMRRGAGGVTRNSHQMIGSAASATSSQGEAKAREPSASIDQRAFGGTVRRLGIFTAGDRLTTRRRAPAKRAVAGDRYGGSRSSSRPFRRSRQDPHDAAGTGQNKPGGWSRRG